MKVLQIIVEVFLFLFFLGFCSFLVLVWFSLCVVFFFICFQSRGTNSAAPGYIRLQNSIRKNKYFQVIYLYSSLQKGLIQVLINVFALQFDFFVLLYFFFQFAPDLGTNAAPFWLCCAPKYNREDKYFIEPSFPK